MPALAHSSIPFAAGRAGYADGAEQAAAGFDHDPAGDHGGMRQLGKAGLHLTGAYQPCKVTGGGTKLTAVIALRMAVSGVCGPA